MRRSGRKGEGRFERLGWDEAIDAVATRLERIRSRHGGEAILPFAYGGSNGLLTDGALDARFFRLLGASVLERTVCAAPTGAAAQALYGKMASVDLADFALARFIIVWGANPKHSNIHLMPYLKSAREAGGRVALIDPRLTLPPRYVDLHLPVYPGTDGAVALAMIGHLDRIGRADRAFLQTHTTGWERLLEEARRWPLERAGALARVEPKAIAAIAEAYAAADPALVRCGWGLERNRNGETSVAAVLALPAVAGKFGRPGGGYALSASSIYRVDGERLGGGPGPPTRRINMNRLGRVLLEEKSPPVQALIVYNANPVCTVPDQNRIRRGLEREDLFTVVLEQVMTDTARYADILLPATTFLEHAELSTSYGTYAVMLGEPVVPPAGEALPNAAIFDRLLRRMGLSHDHPTGEALTREALAAIGGPLADGGGEDAGAERLRRLRRDRILRLDFPGERPVQFATAFPRTPDRRARLWPEDALGADPYRVLDDPADAAFPLALISPATGKAISSSLAEYGFDQAYVQVHPDDAAARGLRDGGIVRVHNRLGEVRVRLRLSREVRPGVVCLPKGIWNRHTLNGSVGTALVPDTITAASGGACFNDARVEISAAG
jgi:anaerobic selenocysteine-containing dehydrogenase